MTKEIMLINASQAEEVRVALVKDNRLYDLNIDCPLNDKRRQGNIYKATVTRVEPSLEAVFVDYGPDKQGFLPRKEIADEYLKNLKDPSDDKQPLNTLIRPGQELLIQVDKEERGNKGAALTTFITLAGCYLVLMPNNPHSGGISRRIEGEDRDELKGTLGSLTYPEEMGLIIRTAGVGKCKEELQADLDMLCNQWQAIRQAYTNQLSPCLIHQEGDVIISSIRDNLRKSISAIIIDDDAAFIKARRFIELVFPAFLPFLQLYKSAIPLFQFYQIESQIEAAYQREVILPSGGGLVIDRTEALVSIDVNSAKATSGADIEATAFNTNLEAANEIARQLRLRDLGGLVVIDFIDMSAGKNQREVENQLKEALKADRARIQVGRISRFGLLEMSRQRLRLSLGETAQEICSRCEGRGTVRNIQSHGLSLIRLIEEEALKEKTAEIQVQLSVEMATFTMNEKRTFIAAIEKRHGVNIVVIANPYLQTPNYTITRLKQDNVGKNKKPSYLLIEQPQVELTRSNLQTKIDEPAVKSSATLPALRLPTFKIYVSRLWSKIVGKNTEANATTAPVKENTAVKPVVKPNEKRTNHNRRRRPNQNNPNISNPNNAAYQPPQNRTAAAAGAQPQPQKRRNPNHQNRASVTKLVDSKTREISTHKDSE